MIEINNNLKFQDNFLPLELIDRICYQALNSKWHAQTSTGEENPNWFWQLDFEHFKETENLKQIINDHILRIYINGQSYTQHGDFHQDDGEKTYLIGLNKDWSVEKGGATEFLLDNQSSMSIYPIYNRVIIFNSTILHRALPNLNKKDFRMTLAIKTRSKDD